MISAVIRTTASMLLLAASGLTLAADAHGPVNGAVGKAPAVAAPAQAALDAHTKEDIARHEGMAKAHAQAAQCLAAGTDHEVCQKQLQTACKGLALGKHCGLRHAH